jgi:hypothetical protein
MRNDAARFNIRLGFGNGAFFGVVVDLVKNGFRIGHEEFPDADRLYYHTSCLMNSCGKRRAKRSFYAAIAGGGRKVSPCPGQCKRLGFYGACRGF